MSRYGVPFVKGPEVRLKPHPDSCELKDVADFAGRAKGPIAIDLFSGAGGLSLGLHLAGFTVVAAVDLEPEAAETHRANFPGASICADLSKQDVLDSLCEAFQKVNVDLVAGGPPCQPYSQAAFSKVRHLQKHHGKGLDSRRDLWASFVEIVRRLSPRAVLIENVPDMAFGRDSIVLRRLVANLEELGYAVETRVLSSDGFGVPQHRQRLFTVGFKEDCIFAWPYGDAAEKRLLWDAISDLPPVEGGDKTEARPYGGIREPSQAYYRQGVSEEDKAIVYDHFTRAVRQDDLEAFKLMTSKTKYSDLPEHLKRYRDDIFEDKYKRLGWYELSRTITAHISQDGYWYIHPDQHRTLTIREAARIQTFPDNFRFCGFPRHAFKQIGEAVPPLLGKAVASAVMETLTTSVASPSPVRTRDVAALLSKWLNDQEQPSMLYPWLRSSSFWHLALGHILFQRANPVVVARTFGPSCERWPSADDFLQDPGRVGYLESIGRAKFCSDLEAVAVAFRGGGGISIAGLAEAGLSESLAVTLMSCAGMSDRRPASTQTSRMAVRFWGRSITEFDGRGTQEMLVGRMIGTDTDGSAFRGCIEIAGRYCDASKPKCRFCPLSQACVYRQVVQDSQVDDLFAETVVR